MKRILIPTDFSPNADKATDYAVQIARLSGASMILIHACDDLDPLYLNGSMTRMEYNQRVMDEALEKLEIRRKSIQETEKLDISVQLYSGSVLDTILVAAEEHEVGLIIMGTLGISGIHDKLFGSKTAELIRHSRIPVLTIPIEFEWSQPQKFMLAIKDTREALPLLTPLIDLTHLFRTELHVATFTDSGFTGAIDYIADENSVQFASDKIRRENLGIPVVKEHLLGGDFEESINDFIAANKIDLLTMITHKRTMLGQLFHHSLTRKMSYHSRVPVLAIPARRNPA